MTNISLSKRTCTLKRIISDLTSHIKLDFNWKQDGVLFLILGVLIFCNYYFKVEGRFLSGLSNFQYLSYFLILYPAVYYLAVVVKSGTAVLTREFVLVSGVFMLALSASSGFIYYRDFVQELPIYEQYYLRNIIANAQGAFWIFIPLLGVYFISERKHMNSFYGLSLTRHNFKPYLGLIALMIPLLVGAIWLPGFLDTYPTMKVWQYQPVYGMTRVQMASLYEFFYISDFIRVETLFRGALIIGVARFLGKDSIVIMATLYCVLHFNKPLGETISSFFGGYLLGTIAYYQRNIVGGCIVHGGIAGLMELIAYLAWNSQGALN
ncbi:MAG: CPBP family intramembrane metalloprotease [Flavobacteriales bacterium]|nr:CPBP family intramembrane metalloprotease [Flavobacteriales bacterium]